MVLVIITTGVFSFSFFTFTTTAKTLNHNLTVTRTYSGAAIFQSAKSIKVLLLIRSSKAPYRHILCETNIESKHNLELYLSI